MAPLSAVKGEMFLCLDQQSPNIYTYTSLKFARVSEVNLYAQKQNSAVSYSI